MLITPYFFRFLNLSSIKARAIIIHEKEEIVKGELEILNNFWRFYGE